MQYEMCACCGKPKRPEQQSKRFPSHLLLSHSLFCTPQHEDASCPIAALDAQSGIRKSQRSARGGFNGNKVYNQTFAPATNYECGYDDQGGCSRYFQSFPPSLDAPLDAPDFVPFLYQSKASRAERNAGCEDLPEVAAGVGDHRLSGDMTQRLHPERGKDYPAVKHQNSHPTVKPLALMQWLVRLITPPGGIVLDPFGGSGSTAVAAIYEDKHFILVEQDESYVNIARARIAHAREHPPQEVKSFKHRKNTAPNRVNVPIVKDTMNNDTSIGESGINKRISGSVSSSIVPVGSINLKNDVSIRQEEIDNERTLFSGDNMLMDKVNTSLSQPSSDSKLNDGDINSLSEGIIDASILGHKRLISNGTDSPTLDRTEDTSLASLLPVNISDEIFPTNGANVSLTSDEGSSTVDVGTSPRAGRTPSHSQPGISDAISGSTNGANSIMSRHSPDLHSNDIHYTMLEHDMQEEVEAWDCDESCPIKIMNDQGGYTKSSGGGGYHPAGHDTRNGIYGKYGERNLPKNVGKGDEGHVSRYFQHFPPDSLFASCCSESEDEVS